MMKLDLYDKEILLSAEKINLGFAVESELNDLKKKDNATQIKVFMKGVQIFLCVIDIKLFERSPLGSVALLSDAIFDPYILFNASKEKLTTCLKNLLKHLLELNVLSTKQCDVITTESKKFLDVEVKTMQRESVTFSQKDDRSDDFYFKVASISKYKDLSFVVKLILTLNHGQASVERGFSLNANIMKTNMPHESLTAKKLLKITC